MPKERIVVIGAGIGGLVAAIELARRGFEVIVFERAGAPGGKMREIVIDGQPIDAGPTVLTMRPVFEEIFANAGAELDARLRLRRADVLARHAWGVDERLDLFADRERSADAIGRFAGSAEARGYRSFCARARRIYETLERSFIFAPRPSNPLGLVQRVATGGLGDLRHIEPFGTLWDALGEHFADPRLRQLFGRYATYVGSSPFAAPATLMLIAHVEQEGVWLVDGGMQALARALAGLASEQGAELRYGEEVSSIELSGNAVRGVGLATGEAVPCAHIVANCDVAALASGLFGPRVARAVPGFDRKSRSLSAVTWAMWATSTGFALTRHNVFFSRDYAREFKDIFERHRLPSEPTVYLCAQDREHIRAAAQEGPERLFCLVNAPARADVRPLSELEVEECEQRTMDVLARCGLKLSMAPESVIRTQPTDFERMFPATGGALYGQVSHGATASFRRPAAGTKIAGLYLAGGSVHPGAGVPMAAISGRLAAAQLLAGRGSTARSLRTAMSGGMSTR